MERLRISYETVEPAYAACLRPKWPPEGAPPEGIRGCSTGASKPNLFGSTFSIIPKPKAAAMDRQRCGLNEGTAGRDAEAVASRMDRVGRL